FFCTFSIHFFPLLKVKLFSFLKKKAAIIGKAVLASKKSSRTSDPREARRSHRQEAVTSLPTELPSTPKSISKRSMCSLAVLFFGANSKCCRRTTNRSFLGVAQNAPCSALSGNCLATVRGDPHKS